MGPEILSVRGLVKFDPATLETAYKEVAICHRGNLLYKQIYFINDLKLV